MIGFWIGAIVGAMWAAGMGPPSHLRIRRAVVDGRGYRVLSHGPGMYEVFSEAEPDAFVLISQSGELAAGGRGPTVEIMRDDMARFPPKLFA